MGDLPPLSHQALFAAVRSADAAAVRALLADAEASDTSAALAAAQTDAGETALYVAAEAGSEELVRMLLPLYDFDAVTVRSRLDLHAFHVAAKQGHAGVVKEFLERWPALCSVCDSSNTSPLYSAAVKDHLDVVTAILDTDDSCVRIVRRNGKTSLHTAARIGYHRIVKELIERDPGIVPIRDRKGQTALHMAVKGKNTDVVEELLMADVSILNVRDKKGNTALHIATRKWRPQSMSAVLCMTTRLNISQEWETFATFSISTLKQPLLDGRSSRKKRQFWFVLLQRVGLAVLAPQPFESSFDEWWSRTSNSVEGTMRKGLNTLIILGAWTIWRHRNDCVFNGVSPSLSKALSMAGGDLWLWSMAGAKGLSLLAAHDQESAT